MSSCAVVDRDAITAAFDALDAAVEGVLGLDFEALTTRERLAWVSADVDAKHPLLKEVCAAGRPAGSLETRCHPFRTISHCHRFSHLRAKPRR
jgi:hypothetical protein